MKWPILASLPLLLAACGGSKNVVVVYSPHGQEVLGDYERLFEAAHPDVDLQWLDMGSKEVHTRIAAEKARPACDVWWGGPHTFFQQAAKEGLLEPYQPHWSGGIPEGMKDAEGRWYATHRSPLVILFNNTTLDEQSAPQTWDALLDSAWAGKLVIRKPQESGTMRTFLAAMILRQPDEVAGLEWLRKLHAATAAYPESPTLLFDHLKKNPERVSVWLMPDVIMQRNLNGYPFGYVVPPQTPVIAEGIAIVKGAPHPELARQFFEFVTTKEALKQQAERYAKLPARTDIAPEELPEEMRGTAIEPMQIDWATFGEQETALVKQWETEVYTSK